MPQGIHLLRLYAFRLVLCGLLLAISGAVAFGQISPAEIRDSQLKELEGTYFQNLITLNRSIAATKFPLPFALSRYAGLDPQEQLGADSRGIEFVKFHDRVVLKITGNYNAAFNTLLLTQNQRASHVFTDVVVPLLGIVKKDIPADVACDAVGFEIAYHIRARTKDSDYEGKEILVVVFDRADAFGYGQSSDDAARQDILKRSEIYVNGNEFGLALGESEPYSLEGDEQSTPSRSAHTATADVSGTRADTSNRTAGLNTSLPPGFGKVERPPEAGVKSATDVPSEIAPLPTATEADAERLQAKYQPQLDALAKEGLVKFHFVDYAPPSFVVFRNRVQLQLTIRNPNVFEKESGSIYKRAAQSFDLFLAQQLKALLDKVPADPEIDGLDITVLDQLGAKVASSSEALEYVLPLKPLRQFVEAGITNQQLIDQSVVLVNGVRISLNLQLVE
jgi:hypothetical protein